METDKERLSALAEKINEELSHADEMVENLRGSLLEEAIGMAIAILPTEIAIDKVFSLGVYYGRTGHNGGPATLTLE